MSLGAQADSRMPTYMVRAASRHLCELLATTQGVVERITLLLGAVILPIGRPLVRQRLGELVDKRLLGIQAVEDLGGAGVPEDAAVLLARAADGADAGERDGRGLGETVENEVERFHPEGDRSEDFAGGVADVDALADAILGAEVAIEIDLGLADGLEVGVDDDGCDGYGLV